MSWFEQEGVGLHSLQEAIDTTSTSGKLTFHIFASLAEFERQLIQERTQVGLKAARARGRLGGCPKALKLARQKRAVQLYHKKELIVREICGMMGISKPTLYAYVRQAQSSS
jgi:DNA invertase Pin-like site-specific DNA recombinase